MNRSRRLQTSVKALALVAALLVATSFLAGCSRKSSPPRELIAQDTAAESETQDSAAEYSGSPWFMRATIATVNFDEEKWRLEEGVRLQHLTLTDCSVEQLPCRGFEGPDWTIEQGNTVVGGYEYYTSTVKYKDELQYDGYCLVAGIGCSCLAVYSGTERAACIEDAEVVFADVHWHYTK